MDVGREADAGQRLMKISESLIIVKLVSCEIMQGRHFGVGPFFGVIIMGV